MLRRLILAIPMAIIWLALTNELTLESFLLGYVVALAIFQLVSRNGPTVKINKLPLQLAAILIYVVILLFEIFISSLDIARRVLDPRLLIEPAIIPVSVQDLTKTSFIAALSIHAITVTPGEMVVDCDEDEGIMFVHVLNASKSRQTLDADQANRLALIKRMIGQDD